jgi:cell division septum initiation protein DivIVA
MNTAEQQIKRIHDKLQQVLKNYGAIQKENSRLKEELDLVSQKITAQNKIADELKQQVSILKLSNGEMNESEKKEFEKRINSYLKEIDRCIALLESN